METFHFFILQYLIAINIISSFVFILDKIKAGSKFRRTPELTLHFLEILGGVLSIFPLMFIIRHKNRKTSYFIVTAAIFSIWLFLIINIWSKNISLFTGFSLLQ